MRPSLRLPLAVFCAFAVFHALCPLAARAQGKDLAAVPESGPLAGQTLYHSSYALIIGIDRYDRLPPEDSLNYAVKDAVDLQSLLVQDYGFAPGHVTLLTDGQATKARIEAALSDLADSRKIEADDQVLIFFSGHGQTVPIPTGGDQGFLLPCDAAVNLARPENAGPYLKTCIQMETIWGYLDSCPAKHVLMIADACYSGLLAQTRSVGEISSKALAQMASLRARQVMTAGTKGETALEVPALGHGLLTYALLEQLKAEAATPGDVFTASGLFLKVRNSVRDYSQGDQIPQLASHDAEGDFIFIPTAAGSAPDVPGISNSNSAPESPPAPVAPTPLSVFPPLASPRLTPEERVKANAELIYEGLDPSTLTVAQIRKALDDGADIDARNANNETALLVATACANMDCVKFLVAQGADIHVRGFSQAPILTYAARSRDVNCLRYFLDMGLDVSAGSQGLTPPLMYAAGYGAPECIRLLLQNGANVDQRRVGGETALFSVADSGNPDCLRILLAAGAKVNITSTDDGTTALIRLAQKGNVDCIEILIAAGATVNVKDFAGKTALKWAEENHHPGAVDALKAAGATE